MNAGETVQSTAMLDMDPWTWCGGLGGNPGTATHQLCPSAESFNPHEPQLPICSAAHGGVNANDAFTCSASASHLVGIHTSWHRWHWNPYHLTRFPLHTRHLVGQ